MVKRSGSGLRTLAGAVGVVLVVLVPLGAVLLREGQEPSDRPEVEAGSQETRLAEAPVAEGVALEPPPPAPHGSTPARAPVQRPSGAQAAPAAQPEPPRKKPTKPPSVRLVAIRKMEAKGRGAETVDLAEELVRDVAEDPTERTVLLSALGVLHRVEGGAEALIRLSDDPPTPEVGQLAAEYLMRPKTQ